MSSLPEGAVYWFHINDLGEASDTLNGYGLYDAAEDQGFIGEPAVDETMQAN